MSTGYDFATPLDVILVHHWLPHPPPPQQFSGCPNSSAAPFYTPGWEREALPIWSSRTNRLLFLLGNKLFILTCPIRKSTGKSSANQIMILRQKCILRQGWSCPGKQNVRVVCPYSKVFFEALHFGLQWSVLLKNTIRYVPGQVFNLPRSILSPAS